MRYALCPSLLIVLGKEGRITFRVCHFVGGTNQDGEWRKRGARPRNLRNTLLAARPAQEYDVDLPGAQTMQPRLKTIVIGTWLYELPVMASKSDIASAAAREFFDSFAFQAKAKPSSDASER